MSIPDSLAPFELDYLRGIPPSARYQALDVVRGVVKSGRFDDIALYSSNDVDFVTENL